MFKRLLFAVTLLLTSLLMSSHASALSCAPTEDPTKAVVDSRDYIFFGTATESSSDHSVVKVKITRVIKGDLGDETTLIGTIWDGYFFEANKENLLMFKSDQYDKYANTFQKVDCDFYDSLSPDTEAYAAFMHILENMPTTSRRLSVWLGAAGVSLITTGAIYLSYRRASKSR